MEWAAANITEIQNLKRTQTCSKSETPEAALARLTSAYSTAMGAVGALHKASFSLAKSFKSVDKDKGVVAECGKKDKGEGEGEGSGGYDGDVDDSAIEIDVSSVVDVDADASKNNTNTNTGDNANMAKENTTIAAFQSIKRVSKAARDAFENAVLSDPLIKPYSATFANTLLGKEGAEEDVTLTSAAHKSNLKELAYASLVNYADLLICGCACGLHRDATLDKDSMSILDRGAVDQLLAIQCADTSGKLPLNRCLWCDVESEERTKRLALVAYCDAADLDGSDPTIWFKLACAARVLGRLTKEKKIREHADVAAADDDGGIDVDVAMDGSGNTVETETISGANKYVNLSYERLERYALERGLTALKSGLPPNRAISRAFREFELKQATPGDNATYQTLATSTGKDTADLIIDLPRYSWSTLGRSLLRACREGVTSDQHDKWTIQTSGRTSSHKGDDFGSPSIHVKISPLLTLPRTVLASTCEYLGNDARRLESTCRSLSVDIISARALIEKDRNVRMKQMEQEMGDMLKETEMKEPIEEPKSDAAKQQLMKFANRSSKRVRSQIITSSKQAERSAKRKSMEYCLVSSIIPCTMDHPDYNSCLNKELNWDDLMPLINYSEKAKQMLEVGRKEEGENMEVDNGGIVERRRADSMSMGKTSLTTFIKRWSNANSGARDMLRQFLAHISCYVNSVYECDKRNVMMLSQCISDCKFFVCV